MNHTALYYCFAGWIALAACFSAVYADSYIVRDGESAAEIVVSAEPSRMARLAAAELQTFIERISGAVLPIVEQATDGKVRIYVGESADTVRLGIRTDDLAYGAYRIVSGPGWLALVGPDRDFEPIEPWPRSRGVDERRRAEAEWQAITGEPFAQPTPSLFAEYHESLGIWEHDDAGTLNAVYDFLRSLGVRWYFPGKFGEVLPQMQDVPLPRVDEAVRPDFDLRKLSYFKAFQGLTDDEVLWNLRLGLNQGSDTVGLSQMGHGMKFVHLTDAYKEKYPDHFAIWGGERAVDHKGGVGAPCLSSEGLFENHLKYARAMFDHYDQPMVNLDVVDGYFALCESDGCRGQGTPERGYSGRMSDYVWGYIDRIARELYKSHPDRMVAGLAYGGYLLPPENIDQLSPNLAVILCQHRSSFSDPAARQRIQNLRQQWLEKLPSGQLYTWDYYLQSWPRRADVGVPAFYPRQIAADLQALRGISRGDLIEVYQHDRVRERDMPWHELAITHLNLYVTARLWWDTDLDLDALLGEYYQLFYGPAAEQMKAFIEFGEANWVAMRSSVEPIDRAGELLAAAEAAVVADSIYGQRVAMMRDYFELSGPLRERLARGKEGPEARIPVVSTDGLVIDGRLDDVFWQEVPEFELRELIAGGAPNATTTFRMAWGDNDSLYIGIRCDEPDMAGLMDTASYDGDVNVWLGDFVEILLETPVHQYYQITISPSGWLLDSDRAHGLNSLWSSGAIVATDQGEGYWSIEIQLPAAGEEAREIDPDSGISGRKPDADAPWHFNLCRQRIRASEWEGSAFSPTGRKHFHDLFKMGAIVAE